MLQIFFKNKNPNHVQACKHPKVAHLKFGIKLYQRRILVSIGLKVNQAKGFYKQSA
jgi:hypothetical protein